MGTATASARPDLNAVSITRGEIPLPTQEAFLTCGAPAKVYIGPFGSGKTKVLTWQAILLSHWFAPNAGLIGRYTYPELRDTTRKQFVEIADPRLIKSASLPETGDGHIEWHCGGVTLFRNLDKPEKFGSLPLGYAGIDEITECPSGVIDHVEGRVGRHWSRADYPEVFPYSPLFGCGNPGGQDHVWKRFFKPGRSAEEAARYKGFQPAPRENEAHLPPGYYANLARGKAGWWIKRFLEGDMRALEGLVWPQFDNAVNVVRPFPLPSRWHRTMALDHGRRHPTAVIWTATDYDGNLIVYREYGMAGPSVAEHARSIIKLDHGASAERRVADPSIFSKTQSRGDKWHSVAEEYAEWGLDLEPADNAMQASLDRVGVLLWADPERAFPSWHPRAGQRGSPRLFFFATCERTIEEVSSWKMKPPRPDGSMSEGPVDVDDDFCDCVRYTALSFPEATARADKPLDMPTPREWQRRRLKGAWTAARKQAVEGKKEPDYL